MWYLVWWPYAILHGLNPFIAKVAWVPTGFNVTWGNSIPGAALLMSPITLAFGPVVSLNVLSLLAPVLAAGAAFILCEYVSESFWPSLLGGYTFGFSPYILGQLALHISLALVFPVPLAIYLVILHVQRKVTTTRFEVLLTLLLAAQYLFRNEIVALC